MTTFVLVHGAWHGPWAWHGVAAHLRAAGMRTITPELGAGGLHDDAGAVARALPAGEEVVLVGHSYAGLVVREAADARPDAVGHVVLLDGWAGPDGASLVGLAPAAFGQAMRAAAAANGDGRLIPAPPPAAFGVTEPDLAAWLAARLRPQALRTFTEPTRLTGAVDSIPGTAVHCRPSTYPFDRFGEAVGYATRALDGPHDVPLTDPGLVARALLAIPEPPRTAVPGPARLLG
ncbi:esterase/lipase family protein [Amycolatopsis sp. cg9]|uniref:esterase/lipase family protein n=1 Tax=Amycolatopsis sp. cg9 TaxID=3238801 RepID=UPI003525F23F